MCARGLGEVRGAQWRHSARGLNHSPPAPAVDEAEQIAQPVYLRPLRFADTFVLVRPCASPSSAMPYPFNS